MVVRLTLKALFLALLVCTAFASRAYAAPPTQSNSCLWFTQTANGQGGYSVCDDGAARFRTAYERFGLQQIGYPISQRYTQDGFTTQAFQKGIMQWRADGGTVALVNIFDDLHQSGVDQTLLERRQTPLPLPAGWDGGASFSVVTQNRQALLNSRSALRSTYFASPDPLTFFGLPTSEIEDMGNHYAIRLQRAVLQEWKETVPWARAGQVTIANGGDIAKEMGLIPASALAPLAQAPANANPPAPSAPAPSTTQAIAKPTRIRIPSIGVNALIEHVGLDANLAVDVPKGVMNAAWWQDGPIPGNPGNSILVGHYDDYKGDPAVFWDLNKLKIGDRMSVVDGNGGEKTFEVVEIAMYRFDDLSIMDKLYGPTLSRNLNLITCGGVWDPVARNYDQRLVIYTRLVQ
jgi:sortase (surface protein transpeptidase)